MKTQLDSSAAPACIARALTHIPTRHAGLWVTLGLLAALAFGPPPAQAAVTEAWVHRYNNVVSNSADRALKVVRDTAGDIIVTGTTYDGATGGDILTIKYSGADGSVLWQKRYDGMGNDGDGDYPTALAVDGNGNVLVTGGSNNGRGESDNDYYTAKYAAADGALLWEKRYNGPADGDDSANALAVDSSGNVVVTGYSWGGASGPDYYTAKYAAADGALLWEKRYNGPAGYDRACALAVDGSGNVVVTGSSYSTNFTADFYTAKYAAVDGALLWEKRYNGPANAEDVARSAALDSNGNVVVTGYSQGAASDPDYYTAKYAAADGALLWEKRYNGPAFGSDDRPTAITVDGNGNVVVTGFSGNGNAGGSDYYTAKYAAANGVLLWEKRYTNGSAQAVAVDGSGNVVVTGSTGTAFNNDYYTAKYAAANGALLWEKRCNASANANDYAQAMTVDVTGNVVVTGFSFDEGQWGGYVNSDYYTAKYAAVDGALLWEKRYDGPRDSHDVARAVAVDHSGNVVVTGGCDIWSNSDQYTAKYSAADGALLWDKRYTNGGAQAVAVDDSGNVVVTGISNNGSGAVGDNYSGRDYYTAKYAAANGALLWEKRYNGPANKCDAATAVAVDGSGNVVVTGSSNNGTNDDYYTAKYAATDGALLWEKRYNGPANSFDVAQALALDSNGNVAVTGYSYNATNADCYTAKYAAGDGTLLWEKRYNSAANGEDRAQAAAVDGSGNVVVTGYSETNSYTAKYAATDGTLLWEKRSNGGGLALALDASGNVVVTGSSYNTNYNADFYTAKYAAANGALLWEKRYNGPGDSHDEAGAVAVDASGNVVVTGSSNNGAPNWRIDYYTAKYAAADGALLWEKRYDGPAHGDDGVASLALGPNGMVAVTGSSSGDYATVVYREILPPVSIALVPTGVRLRFTGIPGRSYSIERAPAVTGPWTFLNTQTAPASGLLEYLDALAPLDQAFYRTVQP